MAFQSFRVIFVLHQCCILADSQSKSWPNRSNVTSSEVDPSPWQNTSEKLVKSTLLNQNFYAGSSFKGGASTQQAIAYNEIGMENQVVATKTGSAPARRLVTYTSVKVAGAFGSSEAAPIIIPPGTIGSLPHMVLAGAPYTEVWIYANQLLRNTGVLRLVPRTMTQTQAAGGQCGTTYVLDAGASLKGVYPGVADNTLTHILFDMTITGEAQMSMSHRRRVSFKTGGYYKLCYSDNGIWTDGTLVPNDVAELLILGAATPDQTQLKDLKHICFTGGVDGTNCKILVPAAYKNSVDEWSTHKVSWALTVGWEDTCGTGEALDTLGKGITTAPFMSGGWRPEGFMFDLGYTSNRFDERNFWICYCANFNADSVGDSCSDKGDYMQVVGVLYIHSVRQSAATLVPSSKFQITVKCGYVNGCGTNNENRIKIVDQSSWIPSNNINNRPRWDTTSGCRVALQSEKYLLPSNCMSVTQCSPNVNGGDMADYKVFQGIIMANTAMSGVTVEKNYDVCFCDSDCLNDANWFKVGYITISKPKMVFGAAVVQNTGYGTLEVINTPGYVQLTTTPNSYPDAGMGGVTNSMNSGAMMKLVKDTSNAVNDAVCAVALPSMHMEGHTCSKPSQCGPFGWKNDTTHVISFFAKYQLGGLKGALSENDVLEKKTDHWITPKQAGIFAVCYCEGGCELPNAWSKVTRMQIRGPVGQQHWTYQTFIPFDIKVHGFGLSDGNKIRIIPKGLTCGVSANPTWDQFHIDNVYYPEFSAKVLKYNSPIWGPNATYITHLAKYGTSPLTEIHFSRDVRKVGLTDLLNAGDILQVSNIVVDHTNTFPYQNPATTQHVEIVENSLGHVLGGSIDTTGKVFMIPIDLFHNDGSYPTFSALQGRWTRTSQEVFEQIESTKAETGLKVCWSNGGTNYNDYVKEAGTLDLIEPPQMVYSTLSLTSTAFNADAPVILAFKTSTASAARYRTAPNSMQLKIYFQSSFLEVRNPNAASTAIVDDFNRNNVEKADQIVCGSLFKELWSNHPSGFPVPKGCYYVHSKKAYYILFDPKNGLADGSEYQIVMHARVTRPTDDNHWVKKPAVKIWSLDDIIERREYAVEVGVCFLRSDRFPVAAAVTGDPRMDLMQGFQVVSSDASHQGPEVDLSLGNDFNKLTLELTGDQGNEIPSRSLLRLFLWPLTSWDLRGEGFTDGKCSAQCAHLTEGMKCGKVPTDMPVCSVESVCFHPGAQRNMLKILLPLNMDSVTDQHKLRMTVPNLILPTGGTFPTRISAQLSNSNEEKPQYIQSTGLFVYVQPSLIFGGVVDIEGKDGNHRPFKGQAMNELYVRLRLGVNLQTHAAASGGVEGDAALTVMLPGAYTCANVLNAPETLAVFGADVPQGRGTLPTSPQGSFASLGRWLLDGNGCKFMIKPSGVVYAGSSILLRVVLNNPQYPMKKDDPRNVWTVTLESLGAEGSKKKYRKKGLKFQGGTGSYANNVAVLGVLYSSIAPSFFTPGVVSNELSVFFKTEIEAGVQAFVRVGSSDETPFDFGRRCEPRLLNFKYYVDIAGAAASTFPLPGMGTSITCSGLQSTSNPQRHNKALLQVAGRLRAGRTYGFIIKVTNPDTYIPAHSEQWSLRTYTKLSDGVDGSLGAVPLNPTPPGVTPRSFGVFEHQPVLSEQTKHLYFVLSIASRLPFSLTQEATWVAIGGIQVHKISVCRFRAIAPSLYVWEYAARDFLFRPNDVMPRLPAEGFLADGTPLVDEDLPVGFVNAPMVEPKNVLEWPNSGNFRPGLRYGFAARIKVPDRPITSSVDAFFIQCGWDEQAISSRTVSAIIEAPRVAALVDASVKYVNNIAGEQNRIRFAVRTTGAIMSGGALQVQGPWGFISERKCTVMSVSEEVQATAANLRQAFELYRSLKQQQEMAIEAFGEESIQFLELVAQVTAQEKVVRDGGIAWYELAKASKALPLDMGCQFEIDEQNKLFVKLILIVGVANNDLDNELGIFLRNEALFNYLPEELRNEASLAADAYEFDLVTTNPTTLQSNEQTSEPPCLYEVCWEFFAYAAPFYLFQTSDKSAAVHGFAIVTRMPEASILDLSPLQREAVGRDDRPMSPNEMVISFKLAKTIPQGVDQGDASAITQTIRVRAPDKYLFPEDCVVVTQWQLVFGNPTLWPGGNLTKWIPSDVGTVDTCEGVNNVATFKVFGQGLKPNKLYVFRIGIASNPKTTPKRNLWMLEFEGYRKDNTVPRHSESSNPFPGINQWTFSDAQLFTETYARSTRSTPTFNTITLLFRPYNDVPALGGALRVQAPSGFIWYRESITSNASTTSRCFARLAAKPAKLSAPALESMSRGSQGVFFWDTMPIICHVHPVFDYLLLVELVGDQIKAGELYSLVASVTNPTTATMNPEPFELYSRRPTAAMRTLGNTSAERGTAFEEDIESMEKLDVVLIDGFMITKNLHLFEFEPPSAVGTRGSFYSNVKFRVSFTEPVFQGDFLKLTAPPGYDVQLEDGGPVAEEKCRRVMNWGRPGSFQEQAFHCFIGLPCVLQVGGRALGINSAVQLSIPERHCGELPGIDLDTKRTLASGEAVSAIELFYFLGPNVIEGRFRVCYCHGDQDGGCSSYKHFCQEAGFLDVSNLCAASNCPTAPSCTTFCDPRTSACLQEAMNLPNDMTCVVSPGITGTCKFGQCVAPTTTTTSTTSTKVNSSNISKSNNSQLFQVNATQSPQWVPEKVAPSCVKDVFRCNRRSLIWKIGYYGYDRFYTLNFDVGILHPEDTPPEDNLFRLVHERETQSRSSGTIDAYDLRPQLQQVSLELVGALRAGGSLSSIVLRFRPISAAASVWFRAKQPLGFDFSRATVAKGTIEAHYDDALEVAMVILPEDPVELRVSDVLLPYQGGRSIFDVLTFNGSTLKDSSRDVASFRIPCFVDVFDGRLSNMYKQDTTGNFRIESTYGNRLDDWARLHFKIRLGSDLPAGSRLTVQSPSWVFDSASSTFSFTKHNDAAQLMNFVNEGIDGGRDQPSPMLSLLLTEELYSRLAHVYILEVDVLTPKASACGCWVAGNCPICESGWQIEVEEAGDNAGPLPLGTNDGLTTGFPLVSKMRFTLFATRTPPNSLVKLQLRLLTTGALYATMLILIAPEGYQFPYQCLASSNVTTNLDIPTFKSCTGRLNTAVLVSSNATGVWQPVVIQISMITPPQTPADERWFLEGRRIEGNVEVGWDVLVKGLPSEPMETVSFTYGNLQSLETNFLFRFASTVDIREEGYITVLPPSGYKLICDGFRPYEMPVSGLQQYSLTCEQVGVGVKFHYLNAVLSAATDYSCLMKGRTAKISSAHRQEDVFQLTVLDKDEVIVEANYQIPSQSLIDYAMETPYLLWYDIPSAQGTVFVTVGFTIQRRMPPGLEILSVTTPMGVYHGVKVYSRRGDRNGVTVVWRPDTQSPTEEFPRGTFGNFEAWTTRSKSMGQAVQKSFDMPLVQNKGWLQITRRDRVNFVFDKSKEFPPGEGFFRLPVQMPNTMPALNVWIITLTWEKGASAREGLNVPFVIPGFNFGEQTPPDLAWHTQYAFQSNSLEYYEFSEAANAVRFRTTLCSWLLFACAYVYGVGVNRLT